MSYLTDDEKQLQEKLWSLSLEETQAFFEPLWNDPTAQRTLCRVSLFFLITKILKWEEYNHPWSFQRIKEVEQQPDGCIDLWARGHGKSSIITVAKTIQDIILRENVAILIFSFTHTLVKKHTKLIKTILETNEDLKSLFPERFYQRPQVEAPTWTETEIFVKRTIPRKEATVKGCGFNTALPTGDHADILVFDDIVTEKSITTPEQIQHSHDQFYATKPLGSMESVERIIGTRYSFNDLFSSLIESKTYHLRLHAATSDGSVDPDKLVMFTKEKWADVTAPPTTMAAIACQYLLDPLSGSERVFNVQNLEHYEVRPTRMNVYILVDPANSKKKDSCDTAMAVIGVAGRKRKYLLDGYCHRMNLSEKYQHLKRLHQRWTREQGVMSIKVGYESYGAGELDLQYIEDMLKKDQYRMRIEELNATATGVHARKNERIARLQPAIDSHQWFVPYPTNENRLTSEQRKVQKTGNTDLIAQPIRAINSERVVYDLTDMFKSQLQHFPKGKKDLIDAASRIDDISPADPTTRRKSYSLPESELT